MKATEKVDIDTLISRADALIKEGTDFLMKEGKILELDNWLSITEYAKKYNLSTQNVSQWIRRGVISEDDYIEIGKFGKKLVRDVPYRE
ncbi:hypothetical protein GCM10027275_12210 [Rhabdobacter roseus]|uniref:Helix-turn-helix domain-containing protein n=1 Tax=Rhabdobacter roseus TaxID=1655419 RepID=A0A840TG45_9BACT|nr:hypothetical protein [Rhabdobacter roseus]MBB5283136.1 hypothetical protein [Rhabdobacter roseus]